MGTTKYNLHLVYWAEDPFPQSGRCLRFRGRKGRLIRNPPGNPPLNGELADDIEDGVRGERSRIKFLPLLFIFFISSIPEGFSSDLYILKNT